MGCRIIAYGKDDDGNGVECAVFYCSTTGVVFGTLLSDLEEAQSFQEWVFDGKFSWSRSDARRDLRQFSHQEFCKLLDDFRQERENEK